MGRHRSPIPTVHRGVTLTLDLWTRIDLLLFSTLENRVPHSKMREFFESAVEAELTRREQEFRR